MDTQTSQPADAGNAVADTSALDTNQAAAVMASLLGGEQPAEPKKAEPAEGEEGAEPTPPAEEGAEATEQQAAEEMFTVPGPDGKDIEISKSELINGYKAQKASTQKFEAAAALRREADAANEKARVERQQYAQGLHQAQVMLTASLQEQERIDWDALMEQDPQEYLKQKRLQEKRQASLHEANARSQQLQAYERAEHHKTFIEKVQAEQQELLAKLPDWKDKAKRAAEEKDIFEELTSRGFEAERIVGKPLQDGSINPDAPGITDHKILLLARDAMLYRKMMSKAKAAAQKVSNLPQRTVAPDSGSVSIDKRGAAFQKLSKTGSPRDAASLMAQFV